MPLIIYGIFLKVFLGHEERQGLLYIYVFDRTGKACFAIALEKGISCHDLSVIFLKYGIITCWKPVILLVQWICKLLNDIGPWKYKNTPKVAIIIFAKQTVQVILTKELPVCTCTLYLLVFPIYLSDATRVRTCKGSNVWYTIMTNVVEVQRSREEGLELKLWALCQLCPSFLGSSRVPTFGAGAH